MFHQFKAVKTILILFAFDDPVAAKKRQEPLRITRTARNAEDRDTFGIVIFGC